MLFCNCTSLFLHRNGHFCCVPLIRYSLDFWIASRIFSHSSYFVSCLVYVDVDIVRLSPVLSVPLMYYRDLYRGLRRVDCRRRYNAHAIPCISRTKEFLCRDFDCRRSPSTRVWSSSTAAASPSSLSALLLPTFVTFLFARRSPVHRCPQGLGAEGQPARLLDHGLVQWRM